MPQKGFTLIELLLYIAVLLVITLIFGGILSTATQVQIRETSANEVAQQLNFTMQRIQMLIRESSAIIVNGTGTNTDAAAGSAQYVLMLRMRDPAQDPVCITTIAGRVVLAQGTDPANPSHCNPDANQFTYLTTEKVVVPNGGLTFVKFYNFPGHDVVQVNLTLNYNTTNPIYAATREISSGVMKVSAATFDSPLIPGGSSSFDIGSSIAPWNNLYLNGGYSVQNGQVSESANYDAATRGFMLIGAYGGSVTCDSVCSSHGLACGLNGAGGVKVLTPSVAVTCSAAATEPFMCFCN